MTPSQRTFGLRSPVWPLFVVYAALGIATLRPEWLGFDLELRRVVWFSSGVALAVVLRTGLWVWPAIALGEMVITLVTGDGWLHAFGTAVGNTTEIGIAWVLLRRAGVDPNLRRAADVLALVVLAAGVASLVGAAISTASLVLFEGLPLSAYRRVWVLWWLTHANGMLLVAPLLLAFTAPARRLPGRWVEAAVLALALVGLGVVVFGSDSPDDIGRRLLYAPFPLLLWAGLRFGIAGAATASLLLSMAAMVGTVIGLGPFVSAVENQSLFQLWVFVAVNVVTALVVAGMVDERRRTEGALSRSEAQLRSVVESTADALVAVDADGRVSFTNRRFAELWDPAGRREPRGELDPEDERVAELMVPGALPTRRSGDDPELPHASETGPAVERAALLAGVDGVATQRFRALLGSRRTILDEVQPSGGGTFERYSAPLQRDGRVRGRIWSFRDLSERRRAEEERQRLEQQMLHAQKLESLGVLAGGIAHDFNNLLVAVMGNADLAEAALEPGHVARDPVEEVIRVSQRAADLCQQMLAYAGKGRVSVGPVDLNDVVREMTELMSVSISKNAWLGLELDDDLPRVRGDVVQLRQVVLNLLTNASDALAESEGEIRMATYRATTADFDPSASLLDERPLSNRLVALEVADTGCGMDEATRQRIFDPFFSTKAQGRGLGLAAVLGIVRGHKSTLELWSAPGEGTRVRILLPAMDRAALLAEPPVAPAEIFSGEPLEGTVLLVDDEESVREVASRLLQQAGLDVVEAVDGKDALDRYDQLGAGIDVVLMDLTMPRMNGIEAARRLLERNPRLPIVLSTGYSTERATSEFGDELPVLRKPYGRDVLLARIREALDRRGG